MSTVPDEYCVQCGRKLGTTRTYMDGHGPYCCSCRQAGVKTPIYPTWSAFEITPSPEQRMAKMEAALRQVEQIAVSSQSWRDGKEELDKIKWICREALAQP